MSLIELTEILGNVGEFIGSIAVLATLLYLALQIRLIREQIENDHKSIGIDSIITRLKYQIGQRDVLESIIRASDILDPDLKVRLAAGSFWKPLVDGGMTLDQVDTLWNYYEIVFLEHYRNWRTAPTIERSTVWETELAQLVQNSKVFTQWWQENLEYPTTNEQRAEFEDKVQARIVLQTDT